MVRIGIDGLAVASAPGRVNILGNPTDGLEGAYATISAAIGMRAYVRIETGGSFTCSPMDKPLLTVSIADPDGDYGGIPRLFNSAVKVLQVFFPDLAERVVKDKPDIFYRTEVPPEGGLAGSTAFIAAFLEAVRYVYGFDRCRFNDYIMAEVVQRAEEYAGVTCGYADRYVCVMGGLAYMDFRGKLHHKPLKEEPLATYERLDSYVDYIPLLICYLGVRRSSGDIHRVFRGAYMREWRKMKVKRTRSRLVNIMRRVGWTAMMGKYALLEHDWETFGKLMILNHKLVDEAMRLAGFQQGAGYYNNLVIQYALKKGALGAKLSGAGGGGSVLVLTPPDREACIGRELSDYMRKIGLEKSRVFNLDISRDGVRLEEFA